MHYIAPLSTHLNNLSEETVCTKLFCCIPKDCSLSWGKTLVIFSLQAELATFSLKKNLAWKDDWQSDYGYSEFIILANIFLANDKLQVFMQVGRFGKFVSATVSLAVSNTWRFFSDEMQFLILYKEICQHLEDLHNSVKQFSKWPIHEITKSCRCIKAQSTNRPKDFSFRLHICISPFYIIIMKYLRQANFIKEICVSSSWFWRYKGVAAALARLWWKPCAWW